MKRLSSARFFRVDIEEQRLFLFGPVTQKAESYYTFQDSIRPQRTAIFSLKAGAEMVIRQLTDPVLVFHEKVERVYWHQHRFILCTKPEHTPAAVITWVQQHDDRKAKRAAKQQDREKPE